MNNEVTPPQDDQAVSAEAHVVPETDSNSDHSDVSSSTNEPVDAATPELSLDTLQAALQSTQEQLDQQNDAVLRTQADMQNVRRRAERDVENARKYALEKFAADVLPVIDSLERGLDAVSADSDDEAVKAMREGMVLTLKVFLDVLKKYGVEPISPEGEPFDPQHHEAMSMQENADVEPNSVLAVLQKGYVLNGRLLRAAMVVVAKAPAGG